MYFLAIGCLQLDVFFPGLSPTHWSTTIGPLVVVLSINAVKELYDDYFRHRSDAVVNSSVVEVVLTRAPRSSSEGKETGNSNGESVVSTKWRDLTVGDMVRVRGNTEFPADLVMVQSSDPHGLCYVETANLDGETNLKVKTAAAVGIDTSDSPSAIGAKLAGTRIECEAPNNQLYKFEGKWVGASPAPLTGLARASGDHGGISLDSFGDGGLLLDNARQLIAAQPISGGGSGGSLESGCQLSTPQLNTAAAAAADTDIGLSVDNILLRGSTLRNTQWVMGVVVFSGADTKLMRNMTRAPLKVSQLERHMNLLVMSIGIFQSFCGILLAALQEEWFRSENTDALKHWYLLPTYTWPNIEGGAGAAVTQFIRYVVLLNALIPISLYVTLELVKVMQCGWIALDRRMWDPTYGVRCGVRTTTLNEELGQVQCVLSDKTGTLTQNVMAFVKCSIGGVVYSGDAVPRGDGLDDDDITINTRRQNLMGPNDSKDPNFEDGVKNFGTTAASTGAFDGSGLDSSAGARSVPSVHTLANSSALRAAALAADPAVAAFLSHLSTCHTVVPAPAESPGEGVQGLLYQAASPDEEALVTGAALMGHRLVSNASGKIAVESHSADGCTAPAAVPTGSGSAPIHTLEVLAVNEFSSARKRMSIVVRDPADGTLKLLLKGADAAVLSRLHPDHDKTALETVQVHLDAFARSGLRTLVLAERTLTPAECAHWVAVYRSASCALTGREEKLAAVAELIERDCYLVGATAVEDKLQDGVPETIATLRAAGMLVWMLTGDKLETAVSIANTCRLIDADGDLVVIQESDFGQGRDPEYLANKAREAAEDRRAGGEFGLVIEGGALQYALLEEQQANPEPQTLNPKP